MVANICTMSYVKIHGLSPKTRKKFNRALRLRGEGPQSKWLLTQINRYIRETELKYGDLMLALTPEEKWVIEIIEDGAAEVEQIAEETGITIIAVERILEDLIERGIVEMRRQGGKTEQARGARRPLYFIAKKYESRPQ